MALLIHSLLGVSSSADPVGREAQRHDFHPPEGTQRAQCIQEVAACTYSTPCCCRCCCRRRCCCCCCCCVRWWCKLPPMCVHVHGVFHWYKWRKEGCLHAITCRQPGPNAVCEGGPVGRMACACQPAHAEGIKVRQKCIKKRRVHTYQLWAPQSNGHCERLVMHSKTCARSLSRYTRGKGETAFTLACAVMADDASPVDFAVRGRNCRTRMAGHVGNSNFTHTSRVRGPRLSSTSASDRTGTANAFPIA